MKKILTDVDGVLLDWESSFHKWMKLKGYSKVKQNEYNIKLSFDWNEEDDHHDIVREFNSSAWMGYLDPHKDAVDGVQRLWLAGYEFDVITSMSSDPYAQELRKMNLKRYFGAHFMKRFVSLDCGADKDEILKEYEGTGYWWIEDKPENCDAGLAVGLRPILIDHLHNRWYDNPNVIRVTDWNQLVNVILED